MAKSTFVYTIYIASQPETVWKGLLGREFTRQYWEHENVSDWRARLSVGASTASMRRGRSTWWAPCSKPIRHDAW